MLHKTKILELENKILKLEKRIDENDKTILSILNKLNETDKEKQKPQYFA